MKLIFGRKPASEVSREDMPVDWETLYQKTAPTTPLIVNNKIEKQFLSMLLQELKELSRN